MSLERKARQLRIIRRLIPLDTFLGDWGLPDGAGSAQVLDVITDGDGLWSYHEVIFVAPDDGLTYSVGFESEEYADLWDGIESVEITQVTNVPKTIVVNDWVPVEALPERKVPTGPELRATWAQNRADDAAEADDSTW